MLGCCLHNSAAQTHTTQPSQPRPCGHCPPNNTSPMISNTQRHRGAANDSQASLRPSRTPQGRHSSCSPTEQVSSRHSHGAADGGFHDSHALPLLSTRHLCRQDHCLDSHGAAAPQPTPYLQAGRNRGKRTGQTVECMPTNQNRSRFCASCWASAQAVSRRAQSLSTAHDSYRHDTDRCCSRLPAHRAQQYLAKCSLIKQLRQRDLVRPLGGAVGVLDHANLPAHVLDAGWGPAAAAAHRQTPAAVSSAPSNHCMQSLSAGRQA